MNWNELKPMDPAELDTLVREARERRDREVEALVVRGAKAVAAFARKVASAVAEGYENERERSAAQARTVVHRWANRY